MSEHKIRENRIRRMARRQGLTLVKSRTRDPLALDYGRYMLADANDRCVYGADNGRVEATLERIEAYLRQEDAA